MTGRSKPEISGIGDWFKVANPVSLPQCVSMQRSFLLIIAVLFAALTLGNQAFAQAASNFAYFLDNINDSTVNSTPAGYAVIGEAGATDRANWTASGRIVGVSAALNQTSTNSLWSTISSLFSSSTPVSPNQKNLLAQNIISNALQYPDEFPNPAEGNLTQSNGYVIWAQDFERDPLASTDELYAGVTAVLWAGRQLLGTNVKIIPVPASYLFKTLGGYNSGNIVHGDGATPYLASLGLSAPPTNPQTNSGGEWNFLSMLYENHLIDGFLGQQYAINNSGALPGSVSGDTMHFYEDMPYAILSAHDNPPQLTSTSPGGPPWASHYYGDMPFQAGVYWNTNVIDSSFNPSSYLTPTESALTELAVPEPSTYALLLMTAAGALWMTRRRR